MSWIEEWALALGYNPLEEALCRLEGTLESARHLIRVQNV